MKEGEGEDGRVVKGRHAIKVASEEPLVHYLRNHQHACPGRQHQHQHHQEKVHQQTKAQNIRNDQHPVPVEIDRQTTRYENGSISLGVY